MEAVWLGKSAMDDGMKWDTNDTATKSVRQLSLVWGYVNKLTATVFCVVTYKIVNPCE